jgi:hypothetical protein
MEINLNADVIYVTSSTVVRMNEYFTLQTENGTIDLKVDVSADFKDIPVEYHEIMINMLTSKYLNKVSFGHNPFSKCNPPKVRKWYQFWKSKN